MSAMKCTLLLILMKTINARGRYEFIEEADLPAFYSMRSAQMAQKAQLSPQQIYQDYNPYSPYQVYQPQHHQAAIPETAYSPFAFYSPIYRPAAAAPIAFPAGRPSPVQYHPVAYYHGLSPQAAAMAQSGMVGQPGAGPIKKKSA